MTDYTTLPLHAHDNSPVFRERAWNIGRAYRHQAIELISICQLLSRLAPPKFLHEDAELRRMRRVCDLALRSAADSGTNVTDEANARFKEATEMLSSYSERRVRLDPILTVYTKMETAKLKDAGLERDWPHVKSDEYVSNELECAPTITINFVLLRSPVLSRHDTEAIIVSQELSASSPLAEILWNFSRYKDCARITLEHNPHFYLRFPEVESTYTPTFRHCPFQDPSGGLEHNDTLYTLIDRPSRVFLHTEHKSRIFGNIWLLNGSLIFRDSSGVLEGERFVRGSSTRYYLQHFDQSVVHHCFESHFRLNHRCLRSIVTTPLANPSSDEAFEDWAALCSPASHSIDVHIYGFWGSPGSTRALDIPPPPPTSERPSHWVLYTTINTLEDDILLNIFNHYRLADDIGWNGRIGWRKLAHVCRRWRHLVYTSAFHLGMQIKWTKGTPIVDTLDHLPHLPLVIEYWVESDLESDNLEWVPVSGEDEIGIYHALQLRDRVCHIDLMLRPLILHKSVMLMDEPFPILEHLFLAVTQNEFTNLTLPTTFLAPNLRYLNLRGIGLPKRLRLLLSTVSLVTLVLWDLPAPSYFRPRLLAARLHSLSQLQDLYLGFSIPIPRPSAESQLLGKQGTPVTLSKMKRFTFQGVSAYLERLLSQIRAPLLEKIDVTLFNQLAFTLPHLTLFIYTAEQIKFNSLTVSFEENEVSIAAHYPDTKLSHRCFVLRVKCKPLDWQIDCIAQICSALIPALSGVEMLRLMPRRRRISVNDDVDGTTWHELLRSFVGMKVLFIGPDLLEVLSHALEMNEIGSDPGFLPSLQKLVLVVHSVGPYADDMFASFIHARRVVGRPISLHRRRSYSMTGDLDLP